MRCIIRSAMWQMRILLSEQTSVDVSIKHDARIAINSTWDRLRLKLLCSTLNGRNFANRLYNCSAVVRLLAILNSVI